MTRGFVQSLDFVVDGYPYVSRSQLTNIGGLKTAETILEHQINPHRHSQVRHSFSADIHIGCHAVHKIDFFYAAFSRLCTSFCAEKKTHFFGEMPLTTEWSLKLFYRLPPGLQMKKISAKKLKMKMNK